MKLLIVTPLDPNKESTFIKALIVHLYPYKVLYSGYKPFLCEGKSIFSFPLNKKFFRIIVKRTLPQFYTKSYNKALFKFLLLQKINVVICNYGPQSANILIPCKTANIPLICHFYGYDAYLFRILKKYTKSYLELFKYSSAIISVSKDMSNQLIKIGADKEKIVLNPCGIDPFLFKETSPELNEKRLIFIGRFTEKKAPDLLILAFNWALQKVPDAKLVMIGNGELFKKSVRLIKKLGIEKSIFLLGWQNQDIYIEELKKARAYVQHSRFAKNGDSEGTPVSIIEAAGCGLPIISTIHGGIKEVVVNGVTGFLIDEGDWKSMGNYMINLLENPDLAGKMGRLSRQRILQQFTIFNQMNIIRDLLNKIKTDR